MGPLDVTFLACLAILFLSVVVAARRAERAAKRLEDRRRARATYDVARGVRPTFYGAPR